MKRFRRADTRERRSRGGLPTQDVFSYYGNRPAEPTSQRARGETQPKSSSNWLAYLKSIPTYTALAVFIGCAVYLLSLDTNPKITPVTNSSGAPALLRSQQVYQTAATKILANSVLNRTKITIDTEGFNRQMKAEFPELADASVTLPLIGHRPMVELSAVQPILLLTSTNGSFLLGSDGRAIAKASDVAVLNSIHVPTVTDESNVPVSEGKGVLTQQAVTFITTIVQELQAKQLTISALDLPRLPNELHTKIAGAPYFIKFDMNGDPKLQAGTFLAVKQKLDGDHVTPSTYIDVRVPERAYYK